MSIAAGSRFGPYDVLALIGAGGMGEVYRARDTRLRRDIALKILPQLLASEPERSRVNAVADVADLSSMTVILNWKAKP